MTTYFTKNEAGEYIEIEVDDAKELKSALEKEREAHKTAKAKAREKEEALARIEEERLTKEKEFQTLWENAKSKASQAEKELQALKDEVANGKRDAIAQNLVNSLTKDTSRAEVLKSLALSYIQSTPDGVMISSGDGSIDSEQKLSEYLTTKYPFLVDGPDSSGGGSRGSGFGSVSKKWSDMTEKEQVALWRTNQARAKELMGTQ